jgi:hypothetical protein
MGADLIKSGFKFFWDKNRQVIFNLYRTKPTYENVLSDLIAVVPDKG